MTEAEFRKALLDGPSGCFLLCGEEYYLISRRAADLRKRVLGDDATLDSFNRIYFEGEIEPDQLREAAMTMPFMAEKILIEWQEVPIDSWKEDRKEEFFALLGEMNKNPDIVLLMIARAESFDVGTEKKPSSRFQKLSSLVQVIRFDKQDEMKLAKWITKHFSAANLSTSAKAPYEILRICGLNMNRLSGELEKLIYYAQAKGGTTITEAMVREVVSPSPEENVFGLVNAISKGNRREALNELYYQKLSREEPLVVLAKISKTLCDMLCVSELRDSGKTSQEIDTVLHLGSFRVSIYMNAARQMGTRALVRAVNACRVCDSELKSGKTGYLPIEKLVCSLPQS